MNKEEILVLLKDSVVAGDTDASIEAANAAVENKFDAYECIMDGLSKGMSIVSDKYEKREMFVPQILRSARAMNSAVDILKPYISMDEGKASAKVLIGVVAGDVHDIGKNLVKLLCESDLGRDVPVETFAEKAKELSPDVIGLSALMTTSMIGMPDIIARLEQDGYKGKVIIGGGAVSENYAGKIGADGYAQDAAKAVKLIRDMTEGDA